MQRKIRGWQLAVIGLLLLICLTGCKNEAQDAREQAAYTVTDAQGTQVNMPAKPKRILTMSMSTDEVMLGLVEPERMAAVNAMLDDPASSNVVELGKKVETKIRYPSVEEIAALQPDLVIVPDWGDLSRVAALRDLGIPVVVCKGPRSLQEVKETITLLAQAAGEPQRGELLLQKMDGKLAEIAAKVQEIPQSERRSVVLISLMKGYGGAGCCFDEACQLAGVINGRAAAGIKNGEEMSKEKLVEINPDILFLPTYNNHGKFDIDRFRNEYMNDQSLQNMKAIQQGNLLEPDEGYIYNCSQDFVFAVQEIAYRVYGDKFKLEPQQHLSAVEN
ncbi:iron complex transport system substrate-binding protein [Selenomonas ruminantium]|uniref:Iron complex transport system substrate-binding protein n=1 Tax=Selenomonas ruminantium TaxID=971 RepID=A0A1M6W4E2_SELRU|nr:iron complex transport system substrate-binding protein [Selenomonas ruminantium]